MIDLLSKLLANENITIQRGNYRTASFDIKSRSLQLPTLVGMSEQEELLFVLHEVGHALFTGIEYVNHVKKNSEKMRRFGDYMNVIEDVRIERKIKSLYPGSRKDFHTGYALLNERDFFGISGKDVNKYNIIDRINLFFKAGFNCGVKFSPREMEFVKEAETVNTIDEVENLAVRIYAYAAEKSQQDSESHQDLEFDDDQDEGDDDYSDAEGSGEFDDLEEPGDGSSSDADSDEETDSEEKSKKIGSGSGEHSENEPESKLDAPESETQKNFDRSINNSINDVNKPIIYVKPILGTQYDLVSFKEFRKLQGDIVGTNYGYGLKNPRDSVRRSAAYLHREFEMRKAAYRYSRTTVAKSGALDMSVLHQYKTSDDLFKKYNIVPNDKNHGMVALLDFSGSMVDVIISAIQELYTLASFCQMSKIPFQMYFFNSSVRRDRYTKLKCDNLDSNAIGAEPFSLVEIANSKFPWRENEKSFQHLLTRNFGGYGYQNTPLTQSLILISDKIIPKFQKENNLQKVSFVTITDGESNRCYIVNKYREIISTNQTFFIEDMGKKFATTRETLQHTIMHIMKMRYPYLSTVGYFIKENLGRRPIQEFIRIYDNPDNNLKYQDYWDSVNSKLVKLKNAEKDKCIKTGAPGYDSMIIFVGNAIRDDFNLIGINKSGTAASIAKAFSKGVRAGINNKIVLNNLIHTIS